MKEQFKTIQPNLEVTCYDEPALNLEPSLYEIIHEYYKTYFEPEDAKRLTGQYIQKWIEESFNESFW